MAFSVRFCDDFDVAAFCVVAVCAAAVDVVDVGDAVVAVADDDDGVDAVNHPSACHLMRCVLPLAWPMLLKWPPLSLLLLTLLTLSIVSV